MDFDFLFLDKSYMNCSLTPLLREPSMQQISFPLLSTSQQKNGAAFTSKPCTDYLQDWMWSWAGCRGPGCVLSWARRRYAMHHSAFFERQQGQPLTFIVFFLHWWTSVSLKGMTVGWQQSFCHQSKKKWEEKIRLIWQPRYFCRSC